MDTSDVLLAARDALREHGWTKSATRRDDGSACLIGALAYVHESGHNVNDAVAHLGMYCRERYERVITSVNDYELTSEDEACDLLEAAAKWDGGTGG